MNEQIAKQNRRVPVFRSLKLTGDGSAGVFTGTRCKKCGEHFLGTPMFCLNCSSSDMVPVEFSKQGVLRTYTIIWVPPPGWQGQVPYILGSVELPEGVEILSEVIGLAKENIKIGMKMEMVLKVGGKDAEGNEIMVYKWQPV